MQPTDAEITLNGCRLPKRRTIDWNEQYDKAKKAFEANGIIILVGDKQVERLDEEIVIRPICRQLPAADDALGG